MRKALFNIDGGQVYVGYTSGQLWNGWATPYFPFDEAKKIQAEWNDEENPMTYDEERDEFRIHYDGDEIPYIWEGEEIPYIWEGEEIQTVDGKLHLYGIGAYSHIWDELDENDKRYLAEQINEFIEDYNPYEYRDAVTDGDEMINALIKQFADLDIFARCYEIMNNARLNSDQIYAKLEEVLM